MEMEVGVVVRNIILVFLIFYLSCAVPVQNSKDKAEIYYKMAILNLNKNNLSLAKKEILKAIKLNNNDERFYELLGIVYSLERKYKKALESFEKAISINPNNPSVYNNMGFAYAGLGEWEKVIKCCKKALSFLNYPTPEEALFNIANAYYNLEKYDEAISFYKKAISKAPNVAEIHYGLANAYFKLRKFLLASKEYEKVIELRNDSKAYYRLGICYMKLGEIDLAKKMLNSALRYSQNEEEKKLIKESLKKLK